MFNGRRKFHSGTHRVFEHRVRRHLLLHPDSLKSLLLLKKRVKEKKRDVSCCLQELRSSRRGFSLQRFIGHSKATEELR